MMDYSGIGEAIYGLFCVLAFFAFFGVIALLVGIPWGIWALTHHLQILWK